MAEPQVRGFLFSQYVRMVKAAGLREQMDGDDARWMQETITLTEWYPMSAFERMGLLILQHVAQNDVNLARAWGASSIGEVIAPYPDMVAEGNPRETMLRFGVFRGSFFDFDPFDTLYVRDHEASYRVDYGMGDRAEEAAIHQLMGYFDKVLELAGATGVRIELARARWREGDTLIDLYWDDPAAG